MHTHVHVVTLYARKYILNIIFHESWTSARTLVNFYCYICLYGIHKQPSRHDHWPNQMAQHKFMARILCESLYSRFRSWDGKFVANHGIQISYHPMSFLYYTYVHKFEYIGVTNLSSSARLKLLFSEAFVWQVYPYLYTWLQLSLTIVTYNCHFDCKFVVDFNILVYVL